ncbi:hypothetical protein V502_06563 [Pseudogymnoascus sp. VKM F-4520 (FW-2644)]|nr:hypothetical protein V502_06563 [Pseudogymnoascus sp. VKM F-4520 (FW-2644)]
MSGFEIIGVVLGGLPLILKVATQYKEAFEPITRWRRFRLEFRTFINNVDIQKQLFESSVERLLDYADLSSEQKHSLLVTVDQDVWRQFSVQDALEQRTGGSCAVYLQLLNEIGEDFNKLQVMMSLKNGSVDWAEEGKDRWHYQRKRISHSFSKKGPALVESIGDKNRKFKDLLETLDRKAVSKQTYQRKTVMNDTTWAQIFQCIRLQANSLHLALRNGWKCTCETPHLAALQLQERATGDWSSHFIMTLNKTNSYQKALMSGLKVVATVKQSKDVAPSMILRPQPAAAQEGYLNKLRADFDTRPKSPLVSKPSPSILGSAIKRSNKTVKGVVFESTNRVITREYSQIIPDQRGKQISTTAVHVNLPQGNLKKTAHPSELTEAPPKQQQPWTHDGSTLDGSEVYTEIEDLCSALGALEPSVPCLGYLCDDEHRHHQLRLIRGGQPPSDRQDLITLEELLNHKQKFSLSRKQRFRLAVVLAASTLQLQTTPWLTEKLAKRDIYFEYLEGKVLADRPYIYQFFPSTKYPPGTSLDAGAAHMKIGFATRISLINLGILLLELCFNRPIESIEYRNEFFTDGKPNDCTDYLTAMEWNSEVEDEAGLDFKNAIKCCLEFHEKPNWIDEKFTQSIYLGVLQQLKKVVTELGWAETAS